MCAVFFSRARGKIDHAPSVVSSLDASLGPPPPPAFPFPSVVRSMVRSMVPAVVPAVVGSVVV